MAAHILTVDPGQHGAAPAKGNYTTQASAHLWRADALAPLIANDEAIYGNADENMRAALRYLLVCELRRARATQVGEAREFRT